jgi:hypothetical protein
MGHDNSKKEPLIQSLPHRAAPKHTEGNSRMSVITASITMYWSITRLDNNLKRWSLLGRLVVTAPFPRSFKSSRNDFKVVPIFRRSNVPIFLCTQEYRQQSADQAAKETAGHDPNTLSRFQVGAPRIGRIVVVFSKTNVGAQAIMMLPSHV